MTTSTHQVRPTPGDTGWFTLERFGLFIHFGLYAIPASGEWYRNYSTATEDIYPQFFEHFDPDLYDPKIWARAAKDAGMRYAIITTKHHDGFCLFDSKFTDFKATNTPFGRDIIAEFVQAFRAEGLRVGFYYSLIDWNHDQFPIDVLHPLRHSLSEAEVAEANQTRDMKKYTQYMRNQVTELLTGYGPIDIMWFDFSYYPETFPNNPQYLGGKGPDDWEAQALIDLVRNLRPGIIINNRTGLDQDIWTPEQEQPTEWVTHPQTGEKVVWEVCHTFTGSWTYHPTRENWKDDKTLIAMLIESVSCGGNMLFNVGPTARGEFEPHAIESLSAVGRWMHYFSPSIYGATASDFSPPSNCKYTQKGDRLYVHLYAWPTRSLILPGLFGKVAFGRTLHDGMMVDINHVASGEDGLQIHLRPNPPEDILIPVIELILK